MRYDAICLFWSSVTIVGLKLLEQFLAAGGFYISTPVLWSFLGPWVVFFLGGGHPPG